MARILRAIVREVTPPILLSGARSLSRRLHPKERVEDVGSEKGSEWYDGVYASSLPYRGHYSKSPYYFLWSVVADRILHAGIRKVLDLGCGPGQFASLLRDRGVGRYCGVDFSPTCIDLARKACPSFEFSVMDVGHSNELACRDYDCVTALEFLEHVENDVEIVSRLKPGTRFYGTVPNFPYVSHVRHFLTEEEIRERYQRYFSPFQVNAFLSDPNGTTHYLMEGIKIRPEAGESRAGYETR